MLSRLKDAGIVWAAGCVCREGLPADGVAILKRRHAVCPSNGEDGKPILSRFHHGE
jgi:hypothetical protein